VIRDGILVINYAGEEIARHDLVPGSNVHVKDQEHLAGLYKLKRDASKERHENRLTKSVPEALPMFSFNAPVEVERRDLSAYDSFMGRDP
jgi:hypothetical protein